MRKILLAFAACAALTQVAVLAKPVAATIAGLYRGDTEGGGGEMKITGAAPRFSANIQIGGDGCGGGATGPVAIGAGGTLTVSPGQGCKITLKKTPRGYEMSENNCSFFHGASCSFDGTLNRVAR